MLPFVKRNVVWIYLGIVVAVSSLTYFKNYYDPWLSVWDEGYYIASAEKYLQGVAFMQIHPPLGKLLVALGEYIFHPNLSLDKSGFVKTNYVREFPEGYSFVGVRFFSTLLGWASAAVFFGILYLISGNPHLALAFSSLYIFDNAMIVQSRAAMLDGGQIFFVLLAILYFVYLVLKSGWFEMKRVSGIRNRDYFVLGAIIGLAASVRITSFVLVVFFPFVFGFDHARVILGRKKWKILIGQMMFKGFIGIMGISFTFLLVEYIHFSLGRTYVKNGYYEMSDKYKEIVEANKAGNLLYFPSVLREYFIYSKKENNGIPVLNVCKVDENGSYPLRWMVGGKSINFRWIKEGDAVRYISLVVNPVIWFVGLVGVVLSIALVMSRVVFGMHFTNKKFFGLIMVFSVMYVIYMGVMLHTPRVLYLYLYFVPLIFSLILAYLVTNFLLERKTGKGKKAIYLLVWFGVAAVVWAYFLFSPFTYNQPLNREQFSRRVWLEAWGLKSM